MARINYARLNKRLEKISVGDNIKIDKNSAHSIRLLIECVSFNVPLEVREYRLHSEGLWLYKTDVCPKCGYAIERDFQAHCHCCGQRLKWVSRSKMKNRESGY